MMVIPGSCLLLEPGTKFWIGSSSRMSIFKIPDDEKFVSVLSDVVWRFHVYNQYGKKEAQAIKAFAKRAPGCPPELYQEMFELDLKILTATIQAVADAPKFMKPGQIYCEYSDVDS